MTKSYVINKLGFEYTGHTGNFEALGIPSCLDPNASARGPVPGADVELLQAGLFGNKFYYIRDDDPNTIKDGTRVGLFSLQTTIEWDVQVFDATVALLNTQARFGAEFNSCKLHCTGCKITFAPEITFAPDGTSLGSAPSIIRWPFGDSLAGNTISLNRTRIAGEARQLHRGGPDPPEELPAWFNAYSKLLITNCAFRPAEMIVSGVGPVLEELPFTTTDSDVTIIGFIAPAVEIKRARFNGAYIGANIITLEKTTGYHRNIFARQILGDQTYLYGAEDIIASEKLCWNTECAPLLGHSIQLNQSFWVFNETAKVQTNNDQGLSALLNLSSISLAKGSTYGFGSLAKTYAFELLSSTINGDTTFKPLDNNQLGDPYIFAATRASALQVNNESLDRLGNGDNFIVFRDNSLSGPAPADNSTLNSASVTQGTVAASYSRLIRVQDI